MNHFHEKMHIEFILNPSKNKSQLLLNHGEKESWE